MELGKQRERSTASKHRKNDIATILATLDIFNENVNAIKQTALGLRFYPYCVFDVIATNLDRCMNENRLNDGNNIWIALAQVYLNKSSPEQFVEALRFNDLQLFDGSFDKPELAKSIKEMERGRLEMEGERGI